MKKKILKIAESMIPRGWGRVNLKTFSKCRCACLFVFLLLFSFTAFAQTSFTNNGFTFGVLNSTEPEVVLSNVDASLYNTPAQITIPSTVDYNGTTYSVTKMDGNALNGFTNLSSIVFPPTLDSIYACFEQNAPQRTCTGLITTFEGSRPCAIDTNSSYWFLDNAETIKIPCVYDRKYYKGGLFRAWENFYDTLYPLINNLQQNFNIENYEALYDHDFYLPRWDERTNYVFDIVADSAKFKSNAEKISVIGGTIYLEGACFRAYNHSPEVFADNVTIGENGVVFVENAAKIKHYDDVTFNIESRLKVGQWNFVGVMSTGLTFESLDNNRGVTSGEVHDCFASKYCNTKPSSSLGVDWITDTIDSWGPWASLEDTIPGRGSTIMVWPTDHGIGNLTELGDEEVILTRSVSMGEYFGSADVLTEFLGPAWIALCNSGLAPMSLSRLYSRSLTDILLYGHDLTDIKRYVYTWDFDNEGKGDWVEEDLESTDTQVLLKPGSGVMMERYSDTQFIFALGKKVQGDYVYVYDPSVCAEGSNVILKSDARENSFEFSSRTDSAKKRLYAHVSERAENGYDNEDSHMMFSVNEDAVNAYFSVEGNSLLDNRFKDLPYTCALNFHAQKDKELAFTMDKTPSNIRVSLIDLENDSTETVLNLNESVNISVTEGENEGRYLVRFEAMSSTINPIASAESTIEIYNNEDHIFISGKDLKSVEIVNTLGQTMQTEKISGEKAELYTKVPAGAYLVKAYNAKGESKVQKVVINR